MESSVPFLRNGVLVLDWKENKEAGAICFEKLFYYGKNNNIFWFVNNSEYHHREMGLGTGNYEVPAGKTCAIYGKGM